MLPFSRLRMACCVLLILSQPTLASDWRKPESQLAEKIAAITGPGVIALEINNHSSITSADVEQIRRGLVAALGSSGVRVWQPDQAAATVKVGLSENLQSYVWVAEVQQGANEGSVAIVESPRLELSLSPANTLPMLLRAVPLISSPDPILDVAALEPSRRILALGPSGLTIHEFRDGHWIQQQTLPISHTKPLPRDLRGRIILRKDHLFDVYLPGLVCHSTNSAPLSMNCAPSDDPWPVQNEDSGLSAFFAPTRNFFTGALAPGIGKQKSGPAFYSAAAVPKDKYVLWILAGVDGQLHLLDGINQQTLAKIRWGSDIAGIHAACRPGAQIVATSPENQSEDSIQAFELPDREPIAVSQKLSLNGSVVALWTAIDGESATAVYRNSETGNYEAVQLNLACSQ